EDGARVEDPGLVEATGRRVESLFLGLNPEDELPALLGGGSGDAVARPAGECPAAARAGAAGAQEAAHSAGGGKSPSRQGTSSKKRTAVDLVGHSPYPLRGAFAMSRLVAPCTALDNS